MWNNLKSLTITFSRIVVNLKYFIIVKIVEKNILKYHKVE